MPSDSPRSASTPITRSRRSPARSHWPSAGPSPNSSRRSRAPITPTASPWPAASSGSARPWASCRPRMAKKWWSVPTISVSRWRLPARTSARPDCCGATRRTCGRRAMARASPRVSSRGARPVTGGMPPVVWLRPGTTISRWRPSWSNSPMTKRRAPSPRPLSSTTANTPMAMASKSMALRERCPRSPPSHRAHRSAARIRPPAVAVAAPGRRAATAGAVHAPHAAGRESPPPGSGLRH